MKILIAHDGSPHSAEAIADLARAGMPGDAEAIVLSVADAWVAPSMPAELAAGGVDFAASQAVVDATLARARDLAADGAKAVRALFPAWKVSSEATAGSPAWELIRRADEWTPDLLVIGATGRSNLERAVFGTVANLAATNARCTVRVARPRPGASGPARVIVAIDGSPGARAAVDAAASRQWPTGSEAHVVEAVEDWALALRGATGSEPSHGAKEAAEALTKAGLKTEARLIAGDPKRVLLEHAKTWQADTIFVGARGIRALERFLLGSVSAAIASRATCSVEIVRPR